jgi:hypothetical protein
MKTSALQLPALSSMHFQKAPATVDAIANAVSSVAARLPPRRCILRHGATAAGRSPPPLRCSVGPLVQQRDRQLSGGPWTLDNPTQMEPNIFVRKRPQLPQSSDFTS